MGPASIAERKVSLPLGGRYHIVCPGRANEGKPEFTKPSLTIHHARPEITFFMIE